MNIDDLIFMFSENLLFSVCIYFRSFPTSHCSSTQGACVKIYLPSDRGTGGWLDHAPSGWYSSTI